MNRFSFTKEFLAAGIATLIGLPGILACGVPRPPPRGTTGSGGGLVVDDVALNDLPLDDVRATTPGRR